MKRWKAKLERLQCRIGWHPWSMPVPLDRSARDSRRPGKEKWHRICTRLCGAKRRVVLRRVG